MLNLCNKHTLKSALLTNATETVRKQKDTNKFDRICNLCQTCPPGVDMIPFLATEFHSVAGQNKFPEQGQTGRTCPAKASMLRFLVTDPFLLLNKTTYPLGGKICYTKFLKTTYDRQYSTYNYNSNCFCKQQDTMPHRHVTVPCNRFPFCY